MRAFSANNRRMPLTLITGPAGSGKTRMVLERLTSFAQNQSGLCIVPSDAAAFELRRAFLAQKTAVLGEVFLTWSHFIKNTAGENRPVVSLWEQTLLIYKHLASKKLSYFKSPSVGVARNAAETITTLKKNMVMPDDLSKLLSTRKAQREHDLLTIFELYENEKKAHGFADDGDLFLRTLSKIKDRTVLEPVKFVAFDGFHHFTPGQIAIIEHLSKTGKEVLVTLPTSDDPDALFTPYLKKNIDAVQRLASKVETLKCDGAKNRPEIKNVVLRSPFQETRFVAGQIAQAINKGVSPEKISLCLRRGDHKLLDILIELEASGMAVKTHRLGAVLATPLLHESLQKFSQSLPAGASVGEYAKTLLTGLKKIHEESQLESLFDKKDVFIGHETVARSLISLSRLEATLKSLETASRMIGVDNISREVFLNLVLTQSLSFFASPHELSQITPLTVAQFEDPVFHSPEYLFMPQLIEGKIPSAFTERLFFSGDTALTEKFSHIFPAPSDLLAQEAFFFNRLISKTTGEIILSHPAIDHSGSEAAPSSFLDPYGLSRPVDVPLPKTDTTDLKTVIAIEKERSIGDARHPQYHGKLSADHVRALIRKRYTEGTLTPSQIESYATCPFKFFVEHVLNVRPPEEVTPEIQPKDFGTIIHAILERFYREHFDLFKKAVADPKNKAQIERTLDLIVEEVFRQKAEIIGYAAAGLKPYEQKTARMVAMQAIASEIEDARFITEPMSPVEFEWSFGRSPETTLKIPMQGEPDGLVRGRVDRIDTSDDKSRFAIIDYKTGKNPESIAKKIKDGLHVQIPLYIEAVKRFLLPKANALGGLLFFVRKPEEKHGFLKKPFNNVNFSIGKRSHSLMDEDVWNDVLENSLAAAARHIAAVRRADFGVKPKECERYCAYEDVCRYSGEDADALTKTGD